VPEGETLEQCGGGPNRADEPSDHGELGHQHLACLECLDRQLDELVVLRPGRRAGCSRVNPPQTTFTRSNLIPDRTTTWTVYAIDAAGNRSASSNAVVFTTPPDTTPPSPPPTVSASIVHPTWVVITWTKSFDSAFPDLTYQVRVDGRLVWDSAAYTHFTALHLLPESTHEFQVFARDAYGNTAAGYVLMVTTPAKRDDNPPTAPTNVTLGFQSGAGEAWLTWDQSTDETDAQGSFATRCTSTE
jgi:hypothetical protein